MKKVRNKNTDIELIVRKELFRRGYRFRVITALYGRPDIMFPKQKIAIFCDGDFWHGRNRKEIKNYKKFWREKITTNIKRDKLVNKRLKKEGWTVIRLWKTEILKDPVKSADKIEKLLTV